MPVVALKTAPLGIGQKGMRIVSGKMTQGVMIGKPPVAIFKSEAVKSDNLKGPKLPLRNNAVGTFSQSRRLVQPKVGNS